MSSFARVNPELGIAFVLGIGISGVVARRILQDQARQEGLRALLHPKFRVSGDNTDILIPSTASG